MDAMEQSRAEARDEMGFAAFVAKKGENGSFVLCWDVGRDQTLLICG